MHYRIRHSRRQGAQQHLQARFRAASGRAAVLAALILAVLVLTAITSVLTYYVLVAAPQQRAEAQSKERAMRLSGMTEPVVNRLDARFADADNDGIADAPTLAAQLADPPVLKFCYVAVEDNTEFKKAFAEFMQHLSKTTGKPVEYFEVDDPSDQIKALAEGKLQVTAFSTGGVPMAVCSAGFVPVATFGNDKGKSLTHMQIIARADSGINKPEDLRGHELALTDPTSNSGYKAPMVLLQQKFGLLPGRDYGVRYAGQYENSIDGLANGTYVAAAVAEDVLERNLAAGRIKPAQFKVIFTSDAFPSAGLGFPHNLKPELAESIKRAILTFDWKGSGLEKEWSSSDRTKFVPVNYKDDWAGVREIDDSFGSRYELK